VLAGELACLGAALTWAVAVLLFRRPITIYGARAVNLAKNALAAVLLGLTLLVAGRGAELLAVPPAALGLLVASAIAGLTVGDTALFTAVRRLGAHRSLLLQTLVPVFTALLAYAVAGERPAALQLAGGAVVVAGVALVVWPRQTAAAAGGFDLPGTSLGALGALGQAAGIVLAKSAMAQVAILPASFLRMSAGSLGLVIVLAAAGRLGGVARTLSRRTHLARVVPPSLLGTYVSFLLMMAGIAWAPAAVAAVLLGTTPIFSLFLEAWLERRPITAAGLAGTLVAVAGVAAVVAGGST